MGDGERLALWVSPGQITSSANVYFLTSSNDFVLEGNGKLKVTGSITASNGLFIESGSLRIHSASAGQDIIGHLRITSSLEANDVRIFHNSVPIDGNEYAILISPGGGLTLNAGTRWK